MIATKYIFQIDKESGEKEKYLELLNDDGRGSSSL